MKLFSILFLACSLTCAQEIKIYSLKSVNSNFNITSNDIKTIDIDNNNVLNQIELFNGNIIYSSEVESLDFQINGQTFKVDRNDYTFNREFKIPRIEGGDGSGGG